MSLEGSHRACWPESAASWSNSSQAFLTARGESPAAFGGRCIPPPPAAAALGPRGRAALLLAQILPVLPVFSLVAPCPCRTRHCPQAPRCDAGLSPRTANLRLDHRDVRLCRPAIGGRYAPSRERVLSRKRAMSGGRGSRRAVPSDRRPSAPSVSLPHDLHGAISPVAPSRSWRRRFSSSTSSLQRRASPQRHRPPARRSARAG
jgi:hypothetical protein